MNRLGGVRLQSTANSNRLDNAKRPCDVSLNRLTQSVRLRQGLSNISFDDLPELFGLGSTEWLSKICLIDLCKEMTLAGTNN